MIDLKLHKARSFIGQLLKAYNPPVYIIKREKNEEGVDSRLVAYTDRETNIAEQYKILRTNLYYLSPEHPSKTLLITSARPKDGKSVVAANLAITLSLDKEKKVLLIDANLRSPAIHSLFGLSGKAGFSNILNGDTDIDSFILKPAIGSLYIIPAGTAKVMPSEIFSSIKTKNIIEKIKLKFDYIVFDAPPALTYTDTSILGAICDLVILVVKAEATNKTAIEEAYNTLNNARATPKATILVNSHPVLIS